MDVGQWQLFGAALGLGAIRTSGRLKVEYEGDQQVIEDLARAEREGVMP
jgi:hypothetical protein